MHPETEKLLEKLQVLTEDLTFTSESDCLLTPSIWSVKEQGNFSLANLLISVNCLKPIELHELFQQFQFLIQVWQCWLKNIQAYELKDNVDNTLEMWGEVIHILIGQTVEGDWVGIIIPILDKYASYEFGQPFSRTNQAKPTALALKNRLGIMLSHSVDSSNFSLQVANNKDILIEQLLEATEVLERSHFQSFTQCSLWNEPNTECDSCGYGELGELMCRYNELDKFIHTYLTNPRAYTLGIGSPFNIYVIGENEVGDSIVIRTEAAWT